MPGEDALKYRDLNEPVGETLKSVLFGLINAI
jgi:hypothetical protein